MIQIDRERVVAVYNGTPLKVMYKDIKLEDLSDEEMAELILESLEEHMKDTFEKWRNQPIGVIK